MDVLFQMFSPIMVHDKIEKFPYKVGKIFIFLSLVENLGKLSIMAKIAKILGLMLSSTLHVLFLSPVGSISKLT